MTYEGKLHKELEAYIGKALDSVNIDADELPRWQIGCMLFEYQDKFDIYGLECLKRASEFKDQLIAQTTVLHDLFGRNDECFQPRSLDGFSAKVEV